MVNDAQHDLLVNFGAAHTGEGDGKPASESHILLSEKAKLACLLFD